MNTGTTRKDSPSQAERPKTPQHGQTSESLYKQTGAEARNNTQAERRSRYERPGTTALQAVRQKCLDCCCWRTEEVKGWTAVLCPLHPWRFGKTPEKAGTKRPEKVKAELTPVQVAAGERLNAARRAAKERKETTA